MSSPTSAFAIACRMPGLGRVKVSLRSSTIGSGMGGVWTADDAGSGGSARIWISL
jgi:hypothetical protein